MKPFTRKIFQPTRAGVFNLKAVAIVICFFIKPFSGLKKSFLFFRVFFTTAAHWDDKNVQLSILTGLVYVITMHVSV